MRNRMFLNTKRLLTDSMSEIEVGVYGNIPGLPDFCHITVGSFRIVVKTYPSQEKYLDNTDPSKNHIVINASGNANVSDFLQQQGFIDGDPLGALRDVNGSLNDATISSACHLSLRCEKDPEMVNELLSGNQRMQIASYPQDYVELAGWRRQRMENLQKPHTPAQLARFFMEIRSGATDLPLRTLPDSVARQICEYVTEHSIQA